MSKAVFTVNGKALVSILQRVQSLAGAAVAKVHIRAKTSSLEVQAELNSRRILVKIPAITKLPGAFIIEKDLLLGVCKNRADIQFNYFDQTLNLTSGKLVVKLPTITVPENLPLLKFADDYQPLPEKFQQALLPAIHACQLHSVFADTKLSIFMQLKGHTFYVGVSDNYHAGLVAIDAKPYLSKLQQFTTPYLLPIDYAKILHTQFRHNVQFLTKGNRIIFTDNDTVLELPTLQTQGAVLDALLTLKTDHAVKLNAYPLYMLINNMPLEKADMFLSLNKGKRDLTVLFKSEHSEISDVIRLDSKPKQTITLKVDHRNLSDVLSKLKVAELSYNNNSLKFQADNVTYYSQLLQN